MTFIQKLSIVSISLILAFAFGRFSTPTKTETKIETVEVEKKQKDVKSDIITVEVIKPDGTKTTTITDKTETKIQDNILSKQTMDKIVEKSYSITNISLLSGMDITSPKIIYGVSVSKNLLGPVVIGLWGMTNSTAGASIGVSF